MNDTAQGMSSWPRELREALEGHEVVAITSALSDVREAEALLDAMLPGQWVRLEWGMGSAHNREQFHVLQQATGADVLPFFVARDGPVGGLPELREYLGARAVAAGASRGRHGVAEEVPSSQQAAEGSAPVLQVLGYGGLIPFVALGFGAWMAQPEWQVFALEALAFYGAVILSFLGAIHWGLYLADRGHRVGPLSAPVWAVVPAILAWLALLQPLPEALMTLAALFLGVLWVDRLSLRGRCLPRGYMGLRMALTAVAIVSLASGLAVIMAG
ncbi:DUF3429 domain-containing protein [Thioalkalivibrio thiocyanoxidans]|uniref:DUF3429 domain-containing protein n=1 Tax=Thioalkalivibrio thiocyanoxidans TaxID=152475 RepID=UPI000372CCD7|nr:DUF3429 domain-containing protein [Thioalkalivibrio thiocyanoxidans]